MFKKFINFGDGPSDAILVNNADWLDEIKYLEFLRNYGRHFTINRMLAFESVKQRLAREQPLTFLEFNYMLLQSYVRILLHYCVMHSCVVLCYVYAMNCALNTFITFFCRTL